MKKLTSLILLLIVLFAVNNSYAQPKFIIHVTGGYDLPMSTFKGTFPDDFNALKDPMPYFMKTGFHFGADGKYYIGKKANLGITLGLNYFLFNSGDLAYTATVEGQTLNWTQKGTINFFQAALGAEWGFLPKKKANPFIGVEFTGNFFSGKVTSTLAGATDQTLNSASRFGVKFGAGVDWHLSKNVGVVIGAKYDLTNLIGKDTTFSGAAANTIYLDDKAYTDAAGTSHSARNIGFLQMYAGVSFYLMQPKTMVKK